MLPNKKHKNQSPKESSHSMTDYLTVPSAMKKQLYYSVYFLLDVFSCIIIQIVNSDKYLNICTISLYCSHSFLLLQNLRAHETPAVLQKVTISAIVQHCSNLFLILCLLTLLPLITIAAESDGERILKIGQHLPRLWAKVGCPGNVTL